jgi:hypothetical protein
MTKHIQLWTCAIALAAMAAATANAQVGVPGQNPVDRPNQYDQHKADRDTHRDATTMDSHSHKNACKASDIIGMDVRAKSGDDNIGEIEDLMISHDGRVEYLAVSFGGFLGVGDKLFAVPLEALEFEKTGEDPSDAFARIDVSEETLKDKRGFNQDNWPEKADDGFLTGGVRRQAERPHTSQ